MSTVSKSSHVATQSSRTKTTNAGEETEESGRKRLGAGKLKALISLPTQHSVNTTLNT